jgi:hypothetical protein
MQFFCILFFMQFDSFLTFVHFLCWSISALLDFFFLNLGIIRTTGRSEGKNLSNIRLDFGVT